ncbi:UDP-glucose--hexose-1-phosphate uridylyltransferase [Salipaludibacillus sp. LMS25]|jgi:UDPglucose--hexose-1-phosphate uridylyltransferase|uniref:UDP-glucose--hexose-1-phosphate uridylyltransferase n=1 Tax=Salipaludibacillus sp. LMS25 TaxID=2924031 RepID=UPI0020D154B5|nr:UDP-glucose--hexose-1-phosphate uridylyltransferase [Salipaludibacillus sp. LMS25]UTR13349.1 UDP-glucose--hexose-1-phosphate uridylyltransferase [Salipaludibacillus sp. LMS25]
MIDKHLNELIHYAMKKKLIEADDAVFCKNQLMALLHLAESRVSPLDHERENVNLTTILDEVLNWAKENKRIKNNTVTERDLLDTKLMAVFMKRPSDVTADFHVIKREENVEQATAWFYKFNKDVHYIRRDRIEKNVSWRTETEYGKLDITINLSKPEKDPKEIEAAKQAATADYPSCVLCKENVGYEGRLNHPARQNLRTIPVQLQGEEWHLQFSPYVYYHEHAIVLSAKHEPMKITDKTFFRLLDFVKQFPHYFIGSNADLPIVGGSILSHDHYQAGKYEFPMAQAKEEESERLRDFENVTISKLKWPMSVLRVRGANHAKVAEASHMILQKWSVYNDESVDIISATGDTPHHTITPIARMRDGEFEMDLVLRNNRTSADHPMGIFHPHEHVHHIKKENIGLIEVMGLAVLPGRLKAELEELTTALLTENPEKEIASRDTIAKHIDWALDLKRRHPNMNQTNAQFILQEELGKVFETILTHSGVFKRDEKGQAAFLTFMRSLTS